MSGTYFEQAVDVFKKAAANVLHMESAKCKVVHVAAPLLNLVPGIGTATALGIGIAAGTLSKIQKVAAGALEGTEEISFDRVTDIIIDDLKSYVPDILREAEQNKVGGMMPARAPV